MIPIKHYTMSCNNIILSTFVSTIILYSYVPSKAKAVDVFLSGFLVLRAAAMSILPSVFSSSFFCDDLPEESNQTYRSSYNTHYNCIVCINSYRHSHSYLNMS